MHIPYNEFGFDVSHGYDLRQLMGVGAPEEVEDFQEFWFNAYNECMNIMPKPSLHCTGGSYEGWKVFDLEYNSTQRHRIKGWVLIPEKVVPTRGFVVTHGYGGRDCPDYHLPFKDSVLFFPCLRGLGKSQMKPYSSEAHWHVLHDIDKRDDYVLRGCVEDVWQAVSALIQLFPYLKENIGYLGESFGGGIGALALPWDSRIKRAHLCVPTFGNHPLRISLPCTGSGSSVTEYYKKHGDAVYNTLDYYDAAVAARHIKCPVHCGLALMDPVVPSPGQFAIFNAIRSKKNKYILKAGHYSYPEENLERREMMKEVEIFFSDLYSEKT